jgi:hypothetical protein
MLNRELADLTATKVDVLYLNALQTWTRVEFTTSGVSLQPRFLPGGENVVSQPKSSSAGACGHSEAV